MFFAVFISGSACAATINVNNNSANSIKNAISTAKTGDTLNLAAGTYHEHNIVVDKNLIITGPTVSAAKTPTVVIDAQKKGEIFYINPDVAVTLRNLYLENGVATSGGGIYNHGTLNVRNSCINYNIASDYGGGIYNNFDGVVTVSGSQINSNSGPQYGGGIYNIGTLIITSSTINGNIAGYGAGIDNEGSLTVTSSAINSNKAISGGDGGAIYNFNQGAVILKYSTIISNSADYGGAISNHYSLTILGCNFKSNKATGKGNAIYNIDGTLSTLRSNRFYDTATGYEIYNNGAAIDARYNWWGTNINPRTKVYGSVTVTPWLDNIPPKITSSSPVNGATKVVRNKTITVAFNEIIKKYTNLIELKASNGKKVPITTVVSGKVLIIKHAAKLAAKTKYYLILHTGCVTDNMGNPSASKTISFITGST